MLPMLCLWLPLLKSQQVERCLVHFCQFVRQSFLSKWPAGGCWYFKISNGISIVKENLLSSLHAPLKTEVNAQLFLDCHWIRKIAKYAKSWFPATLSLIDVFCKRKLFIFLMCFPDTRSHLELTWINCLEFIVPLFSVWRLKTFSKLPRYVF